MIIEPLLFASISTSREYLKVFKPLPTANGTLAIHANCEVIDTLPTALQDKPKSPSHCLSRHRFTNSNSTFDWLASIKLFVEPDENEAK